MIAEDVRDKIIVRYGHRLMKLKVKNAEIRMAVRHPSQSKSSILRLFISNDAGYLITMHIYKEVSGSSYTKQQPVCQILLSSNHSAKSY